MGLGDTSGQMEKCTRVNGAWARNKASGCGEESVVKAMKEIGTRVKLREKEPISGRMETGTLEVGSTA